MAWLTTTPSDLGFYRSDVRGGERNRTAVNGFAGRCLNHSATPPGKGHLRRSAARGIAITAPGYDEIMPAEQSSDILDALKRVAAALRDADIPFCVGGGLAAWARGGP